jgi:hypothetical protein
MEKDGKRLSEEFASRWKEFRAEKTGKSPYNLNGLKQKH